MTCKCTCATRPHDIACYLRHCPHSLYDDQKIIEEGLERLYGEKCLCKQGDGVLAVQEPAVHSPNGCGPKPEDEKCKHKWLDEPNYQCTYCGSLPTREEKENLRDPVGCSCTKEQKEERKKALALSPPQPPQWEKNFEEIWEHNKRTDSEDVWTLGEAKDFIRELLEKTREEAVEEYKKYKSIAVKDCEQEILRGSRELRKDERERVKEKIVGMKVLLHIDEKRGDNIGVEEGWGNGYNEALSDILALIDTLKTTK